MYFHIGYSFSFRIVNVCSWTQSHHSRYFPLNSTDLRFHNEYIHRIVKLHHITYMYVWILETTILRLFHSHHRAHFSLGRAFNILLQTIFERRFLTVHLDSACASANVVQLPPLFISLYQNRGYSSNSSCIFNCYVLLKELVCFFETDILVWISYTFLD